MVGEAGTNDRPDFSITEDGGFTDIKNLRILRAFGLTHRATKTAYPGGKSWNGLAGKHLSRAFKFQIGWSF